MEAEGAEDPSAGAARPPERGLATRLAAWSAARWLLVLGGPFGLAFALLTPPLQPPDELVHLARAFLVAEGSFGGRTDEGRPAHVLVPRSVVQLPERLGAPALHMRPERRQDRALLAAAFAEPARPDERLRRPMPSLYSPLPYLPQAFGVALARALGAPAVAWVYAGRLVNLGVFLALIALALRIAPAHRFALLSVALLPMTLFLAGSLSADAPTIAVAFLFAALVWREAQPRRGPLDRRALLEVGSLATALGLVKPGYAVALPLVLAIPAARFASRSRHAAALGFWLLCGVVPAAGWSLYVAALDPAPLVPEADAGAQLRWIAAHPGAFAEVLRTSFATLGWMWAVSFVGLLGHVDTPLPNWLYALSFAVLPLVVALDGGPSSPLRRWRRALSLALAIAGAGVTLLAAYLGWNAVGDALVRGVQGRYFTPLAPLVVAALHWPAARGLPPQARVGYAAFAALSLAVATLRIATRYWG